MSLLLDLLIVNVSTLLLLKQDAHTIYQPCQCGYLPNITRIPKHFFSISRYISYWPIFTTNPRTHCSYTYRFWITVGVHFL